MTDTSKDSAGRQRKKVYSDEKIKAIIKSMGHPSCMKIHQKIAAMLQQQLDEIEQYEKKRVELVDLIKRATAFLDHENREHHAVIYDCEESIPGFFQQKGDTG